MNLLPLLLAPGLAFSQAALGPARFTVISPELIRLEYQKDARFRDEPTAFAAERGVRFDGFREDRSKNRLIIDTGRIRLIYVPDGKPFHAGNLRALIASPDAVAEWKPGMPSRKELGLVSRGGWHLVDDPAKQGGLDWYLFGYGDDYKAALTAESLIHGRAPMPRMLPKDLTERLPAWFRAPAELFPYTYTAAHQTRADALPVLRPLYLEFAHDERAYRHPKEYFFGDHFLTAPASAGKIWLPEGLWYEWSSGAAPLFVRGGVPIPMTSVPAKALVVRAYPGEDGKPGAFALYEDDGVSLAYSTGAFCFTRLDYAKEGNEVRLVVANGGTTYGGQPATRGYVFELPGHGRIVKAELDGQPIDAVWDAKISMSRIIVSERPITQRVVIRAWLP